MPTDYSKTVIYKIVCKDVNITDCYVGQTTNLVRRVYNHKYNCTNVKSKKSSIYMYQFIRNNGGWDNWYVVNVSNFVNCRDIYDALKEEGYWFEKLKPTLNIKKNTNDYDKLRENPLNVSHLWRVSNREHILEYKKQYRARLKLEQFKK